MKNVSLKSGNVNAHPSGVPGDIVFSVDSDPEIVRLKANGDILVKGKLVENDKELVDGLREFLGLGRVKESLGVKS